MPLDIVVGPVFGYIGDSTFGFEGLTVLPGGADYDPQSGTDSYCKEFDADGIQCKGRSSGDDSRCAGHRRSANRVT